MNPSQAIQRLLDAGFTEASIAKAVGTTQPTINRIKRGTEPSYSIGEKLMRLSATEVLSASADHEVATHPDQGHEPVRRCTAAPETGDAAETTPPVPMKKVA